MARGADDWFRFNYSETAVERLLGLHEDVAAAGRRDVTIVDLLSWARDPGGDHVALSLALREGEPDAWQARRGPLAPDGDVACVLYDVLRAVKQLALYEQVVIALTAFGFSETEIAAAVDPDSVIDLERVRLAGRGSQRALEARRRRVGRFLNGRPRRHHGGEPIRDEHGAILYSGGAARRLSGLMNGGRRAPARKKSIASADVKSWSAENSAAAGG